MAERGIIMKKLLILLVFFSLVICSCSQKKEVAVKKSSDLTNLQDSVLVNEEGKTAEVKITFVELGSVNCIPCKQMQPIMRSIEEKYKGQVKVVFHDVWKDKQPAKDYGIQLIPTQVFLDENGKEFFRHEGFFAEEEIDKLFETKGIKPLNE
jgi:thioredoxin 1